MQATRLTLFCPNEKCKEHTCESRRFYRHIGTYVTKWNHQPVPRYECKACKKRFSSHTFRTTYLQKKPSLNTQVYKLYCSGMTQRRIAKQLGCDLKTVVRKFLFMAKEARFVHERMFGASTQNVQEVQFDEMETFEHTRLKPVSIALAVSGDGKRIVDIHAASLYYKGRLAALALKKYGPRPDNSPKARALVLESVARVAATSIKITSDAKPAYAAEIAALIPRCEHHAIANRKNQVQYATNPTRRKNVEDPLFWINHIAARIRHDLSRMMRKVWTTTKRLDYLQAHLNLFIAYYNQYAI